jgi:hypothetical protein
MVMKKKYPATPAARKGNKCRNQKGKERTQSKQQ